MIMEITVFVIFLVLQLADGVTTVVSLKSGGREMNPIVRNMVNDMGIEAGVFMSKMIAVIAGAAILISAPAWVMWLLVVFYIGIVVHNMWELRWI